ncbi:MULTISPECIES: cytidine deaminase [Salimicrobium]|uniref:Cytidine deaminase n=2 Tax=Salimicrobium TaxID=351195 RepID=A0ABY1KP94_9BACI|nr:MULTISPECIES: cytidine deaminase [Salimicrobium]SDX72679.1 cytidine deaminase [Salimicrobium album]SIS56695.1 cytidine deaminase [Salimicrobium salexigens]
MVTRDELIQKAIDIRKRAYVPYSEFPVGAAVLTKSGEVYEGVNIENAAYPTSCCAERVAIFKAVADGHYDFETLAVTADTDRPVPPCGSCRQVMSEFFDSDTVIHTTNVKGQIKSMTMEELLPFSFTPEDLNK